MSKEQNFISAIVYIEDDMQTTMTFLELLHDVLEEHFLQYEIIAVNGDSAHNDVKRLRAWAQTIEKPFTIIRMSMKQPKEQCMNAGLDIAIGDYVYEFDSTEHPYDISLIWQAYEQAMRGNDIVSVCPAEEKLLSHFFYKIFNAYSGGAYPLRTDSFRLLSRRAINRAHAMNQNLPYRKAAYAASGLRMAFLEFPGKSSAAKEGRYELAVDSLALYTDFGYKFSLRLALGMLLLSLGEIIYTLLIYFTGHPVPGWTSMVCFFALGLTGIFAVLALILKYLALLLRIEFKKQSYLVESIEKL